MRKFLVPFFSLVLLIFIAACSGSQSESDYSEVTKPTDIKITPTEQSEVERPNSFEIETQEPQAETGKDEEAESQADAQNANTNETAEASPSPATPEIEPLDYVGWEIDERSRDGKVCFAFRQPVDQDSNLILRDYIDIEPSFKFAQTTSGNDICTVSYTHLTLPTIYSV